jgi:hypothetical protein
MIESVLLGLRVWEPYHDVVRREKTEDSIRTLVLFVGALTRKIIRLSDYVIT